MVSRTLKVLTLVSSLAIAGSASSADACCWLFGGGGWGAYRPLSWGSGYSGGCGSCGYSGLGYGGYGCGSCGTGSCGYGGCGSCGYGGYGYGGCGSCGTGACGVQSLYGPACDTCGGGGCSSCAGYCGTSNYLSSSDCCTPAGASTEPTPDSNASSPGTDNFRGAPASGMPRSSIPDNSNRSSIPDNSNRSSIPTNPEWNPGTGEYGGGRELRDNSDYLNGTGGGAGGDAPEWSLPRQPNPTEPTDPDLQNTQPINLEPLDVNTPVAVSYRPSRERVRVWSSYNAPQVAAKSLPSVNAGWETVSSEQHVASR